MEKVTWAAQTHKARPSPRSSREGEEVTWPSRQTPCTRQHQNRTALRRTQPSTKTARMDRRTVDLSPRHGHPTGASCTPAWTCRLLPRRTATGRRRNAPSTPSCSSRPTEHSSPHPNTRPSEPPLDSKSIQSSAYSKTDGPSDVRMLRTGCYMG